MVNPLIHNLFVNKHLTRLLHIHLLYITVAGHGLHVHPPGQKERTVLAKPYRQQSFSVTRSTLFLPEPINSSTQEHNNHPPTGHIEDGIPRTVKIHHTRSLKRRSRLDVHCLIYNFQFTNKLSSSELKHVFNTHDIALLTETLGDILFDMNAPNVECVSLHITYTLL